VEVNEMIKLDDPTKLTLEVLHREIASLRELLETRMYGVDNVLREKFHTVDQQFALVERQRVEQKKDTKDAVDAALTAQKEAVKEQTNASERAIAKSETSFTKQLEQLASTFKAEIEGLRREIADMKQQREALSLRVASAEERKEGRKETITTAQALMAFVLFLIVLSGFLISIFK
jgi:chromosome segregation ATPase